MNTRTAIPVLAATLVLAGCSGSTTSSEPVSVSVTSEVAGGSADPTPTPSSSLTATAVPDATPTPVTTPTAVVPMTVEEAGAYYLSVVCKTNRWEGGVGNIYRKSGYSNVLSKSDRGKIGRAAVVLREGAQALDMPPQPWPDNVLKPVATITAAFLNEMSALNYLARAKSSSRTMRGWDDYFASVRAQTKAETVRLRLGLPAASEWRGGCPPRS